VHSLFELPRSALETLRFAVGWRTLLDASPRGDGSPVVALPGYGGGDGSTALLRGFLRRIGWDARPLGLGANLEPPSLRIRSVDDALAFRAFMGERVQARVRALAEERGERVSLVGWSMGGLYAFDAARAAPEAVRAVVTLAAPYGDPRGTALFSLLRWWSGSEVPLEAQDYAGWLARREPPGDAVPIRILYSPRDGIVPPEVAQPPDHPALRCIAVDSSHLGFGVNPVALREVARQLRDTARTAG
jgi:pimeloyl-ACP methyl ester carboxylesterase